MIFKVSTISADVTIGDLGIIITHPTTDRDLALEFSATELSNSEDLTAAIQAGTLTAKLQNSQYGEYQVDPETYVGTTVLQNSLESAEPDETLITERELRAGRLDTLVHADASNVPATSTSSTTRNVYSTYAKFQDWKVAPNDKVVFTSSPIGTYTVQTVIDQYQLTVVESIPDTAGVGSFSIYNPVAATRIGVDPTTFTHSNSNILQTVLEDFDNAITASSGGGSGITAEDHKTLRQLIHFIDGGPAEGFVSGAYKEIIPSGSPFPTSIIWYESSNKLKKIVEKTIVYNANKTPSTITWKVYDTDGSTVLATVSDSISYSGIFETSRKRTIS